MATLKQLSQQILNEKTNKILPNNIKEEVQIFDIIGDYKPDYNALTEMIISINGEEAQ